MKKGKHKAVLITVVVIILVVISAGTYYTWNKKHKEDSQRIETTYQMQNEALAIGTDKKEYLPYSSVDEVKLQCCLYYYNTHQKNELSLKKVADFLADEYLNKGKAKTYKDDAKIAAYVEWWFNGNNGELAGEFWSTMQVILTYYSDGIDLEQYKTLNDEELVEDVPLGQIKALQASYQKDVLGPDDSMITKVSWETLERAFDIYVGLKDRGIKE